MATPSSAMAGAPCTDWSALRQLEGCILYLWEYAVSHGQFRLIAEHPNRGLAEVGFVDGVNPSRETHIFQRVPAASDSSNSLGGR
jgi:hypothetical protein